MNGERAATPHPGATPAAADAAAPSDHRPVVAIDTATSRAVLAVGRIDGTVLAVEAWAAGHRHAEELLPRLDALLARAGVGRPVPGSLAGVVVGTGPGGFTGLRVGLATARGLARAASAGLVGVPSGAALEAAVRAAGAAAPGADVAVLLPAGPTGRYVVRGGSASLAPPGGEDDDPAPGAILVAVDLAGRAGADAVALGAAALDGLPAALIALGCARLSAGADDAATVAPEYVTLPRGVAAAAGEVAWSPARP